MHAIITIYIMTIWLKNTASLLGVLLPKNVHGEFSVAAVPGVCIILVLLKSDLTQWHKMEELNVVLRDAGTYSTKTDVIGTRLMDIPFCCI